MNVLRMAAHADAAGAAVFAVAAEMPAARWAQLSARQGSMERWLLRDVVTFAQLSPRPARTLIFAAFTAEERGLPGSYFHASHPVVPLARTVAVINMDMIVRSEPDTVHSIGHHYSTLGTLVDGIARAHPELRLTVVNESESYAQSDQLVFRTGLEVASARAPGLECRGAGQGGSATAELSLLPACAVQAREAGSPRLAPTT
jgi:hypothetical protein